MTKLFAYTENNDRNLPEKVFDAIQANSPKDDTGSSPTIHSLIDGNDRSAELPNEFNCFFVDFNGSSAFVTASTEKNTYTINKLGPIISSTNLVILYDFYKKYSVAIDISKTEKVITPIENQIDKLTDLARTKFASKLEALGKAGSGGGGMTPKDAAYALIKHLASISDYPKRMTEGKRILDTLGGDYADLDPLLIIDLDSDDATSFLVLVNKNPDHFIKVLTQLDIISGDSQGTSPPIDGALIEKLKKLQTFLTSFLTNIQVLLRTLATDLAGVYTELRYEFVKYIYQCTKLYNV
jgi:hypothetical protein